MNNRGGKRIGIIFLAKLLFIFSGMAALLALSGGDATVSGQTEQSGCHFQIHVRPPIEFAGPAGGGAGDFQLYRPTKHGANVQVSNVWGGQACSWSTSVNQNWVDLSQASGTLQPEADTLVTVSINERVTQLGRGVHTAEITFTSRQDPRPNINKKVKVKLHAQEPCDLQVIGGTYRARMVQEIEQSQTIIPAEVGTATLSNSGDAPCYWQARSDVSWLTVKPTSGTVLPRSPQKLEIRANPSVQNLTPHDYEATVLLQWRETHDEYKEIQATLDVDAPPCELHFAPGQRFETSGKAGSTEFTPAHQKYVLENRGGTPCYYWQANDLPEWLEAEDEDTIYGKSQTDVLVRVNQEAAAQLRPDMYAQMVRFGAGNVSAQHGLEAFIDVEALPCRLEIIEEEINFIIEPEGLIQSETERLFTVSNDWKNAECQWRTESAVDWLTSSPASGTLAGGETDQVLAKIVQSDDFAKLDAGSHTATLGFAVESPGTADEPIPVTVKIDCQPGVPCAYLHTSHTKTEVGKPADISLTLYNPQLPKACDLPRSADATGPTPTPCIDDGSITAQLVAEVPSGWEVSIGNLAERCSGICNRTYSIVGGQQEFIELIAIPNNAGVFDFEATVYWGSNVSESTEGGETTDDRKSNKLTAQVEVTDLPAVQGASAEQVVEQITTRIAPTIVSQVQSAAAAVAPTATPEPEESEASAPGGFQTTLPGGGTTSVDDQRPGDSGISMNLLMLAIALGVIVLIAAVVGAILFGFKMLANAQRSTPETQADPAAES